MDSLLLKKILSNKEFSHSLAGILDNFKEPLLVEDLEGNILLKNSIDHPDMKNKIPIKANNITIGFVSGSRCSESMSNIINSFVKMEIEKRNVIDELLEHYKEISILYQFTGQLSAKLKIQDIADLFLSESSKIIKVSTCWVLLYDRRKNSLHSIYKSGEKEPVHVRSFEEGIVADIIKTGKSEIVNNIRNDLRYSSRYGNITSLICIPLVLNNKVIGLIEIGNDSSVEYTSGDLKLFNLMCAQAVGVIDNAVQYSNLEKIVAERTENFNNAIEQLSDANSKLFEISITDGLTMLYNRRYFDLLLKKEWEKTMREKKFLSLIMLDVDFFKKYNDKYGHLAGDECLRKVALTIRSVVKRPYDKTARYGGEEFLIILPDTNQEGGSFIAESVRSSIESLKIEHSESLINPFVTISLGLASVIPTPEMDIENLLKWSDLALYQAKNSGRNRVCIYSS